MQGFIITEIYKKYVTGNKIGIMAKEIIKCNLA